VVVLVVDMLDCSVDTHHCSVDTTELFHAYFFYVSAERLLVLTGLLMATGENKYAVNQHVKSFHDRPSNEFDVFCKAHNDVCD
jgi:hypothetical protein